MLPLNLQGGRIGVNLEDPEGDWMACTVRHIMEGYCDAVGAIEVDCQPAPAFSVGGIVLGVGVLAGVGLLAL